MVSTSNQTQRPLLLHLKGRHYCLLTWSICGSTIGLREDRQWRLPVEAQSSSETGLRRGIAAEVVIAAEVGIAAEVVLAVEEAAVNCMCVCACDVYTHVHFMSACKQWVECRCYMYIYIPTNYGQESETCTSCSHLMCFQHALNLAYNFTEGWSTGRFHLPAKGH